MQQEQKPTNKALSKIKPKYLTRVLSDDYKRSIDNIPRGFLSVTNLSNREYRHKSKMIMLLRDEKSGRYKKWEHYEEWKIIPTYYKNQSNKCNKRIFQIRISTNTHNYRVSYIKRLLYIVIVFNEKRRVS